ncbi:MAG: L-threonylcarbamoyladenylate synthase [Actinomycetota bacterium]|nr:L-threonylcarbamoyladenylate synthase [Actinomycetota bacterium]
MSDVEKELYRSRSGDGRHAPLILCSPPVPDLRFGAPGRTQRTRPVREDAGVPTARSTPPAEPDSLVTRDVALAARAVRAGGLVGLPTETVYGLAADATDPAAVARIFTVKGRPVDHPLIVHLSDARDVDLWAVDVPPYARRLAASLWPGPLTLVLPRSPLVADHVTGGQDTVGLRVPAHPVALELLRRAGRALAAPSANRFGRVSPTRADHVLQELGHALVPGRDAILDGGDSGVGVESTIVDATGTAPVILRPGAITEDDLLAAGGVPVRGQRPRGPGNGTGAQTSPLRVPGSLSSHYAPRARVLLAWDAAEAARLAARPAAPPGDRTGLLALAEIPTPEGIVRLSAPTDPES